MASDSVPPALQDRPLHAAHSGSSRRRPPGEAAVIPEPAATGRSGASGARSGSAAGDCHGPAGAEKEEPSGTAGPGEAESAPQQAAPPATDRISGSAPGRRRTVGPLGPIILSYGCAGLDSGPAASDRGP